MVTQALFLTLLDRSRHVFLCFNMDKSGEYRNDENQIKPWMSGPMVRLAIPGVHEKGTMKNLK